MAKKKKQTIGYKYFASGHFVLCHGPIDAITKISFQDKDAYLNEENANKTIYINKPSLFGGDEQSGGVQGNIELLFGHADQQKSSVLQRICAKISNAFGGLISAYRGVCSVVFDNVYIGTAPNMPDSKWRVKRIHTRHDGQVQWYDEKAEINSVVISKSLDSSYKYFVRNGFSSLSQLAPFSTLDFDDADWESAQSPYGYVDSGDLPTPNTHVAPGPGKAIMIRERINNTDGIIGGLRVSMRHDDGGVLYWNGEQIPLEFNSYYESTAIIPAEKVVAGENILFCAAVDTVPSGSAAGIYLYVRYDSDGIKAKEADVNPAHIIRECLTNSVWGIGVAESNIDELAFTQAADILHDEKMGMSIKWTDSTSINEFVDNIKEHINAQLYLDRVTNKWKLYLIRDDYDVADLISLDESNIRNLDFERRTLAECVNSVTVTYWDRERAKDSTVTVQDIARIAQQGGVISQSIDYKGFTNSDLASRVALRDLKTLSSTLASISFDVDESFSESWHEGMPFKLSDESYGLSEAVMRIRTIKRGDGINNTVYVEAIEDSFSSPMQSVIEYVPPIKTNYEAKDATAIAFEVPYIELVEQYGQDEIDAKLEKNPDLSYVGMATIRPNNSHINAALFSDAGGGYDEVSTLDFCPFAELKTAISYTDSVLQLQSIREFNLVKVSNRVQIGSELMSVVSFDAEAKKLIVKRGVFDTVPAQHFAGSILYAWDNYSGLDKTEYLSGEIVSLKALTQTNADQLSIDVATAHTVTCNARAIRPYPPANVKFNQENYPQRVIGDLQVMWSARNRIQQTGGDPIGWFEDSTSVEPGMSFNVELWQGNLLKSSVDYYSGTLLNFSKDDLAGQRHTLKIQSWRDGYKSMQVFEHEFLHRMTAERISKPYNLLATADEVAIYLTWDADSYTSSIDYYNIYRHIQPFDVSDVTYLLLQSNVLEKSFADETAVEGTRYYYRIEAVVEQTAEEIGLMIMSDEIVSSQREIQNDNEEIFDIQIGEDTYRIHKFLTSGVFISSTEKQVDILCVGGGGAGATFGGGGGGGGGVLFTENLTMSACSYNVTVGDGAETTTSSSNGGSGEDSYITAPDTTVLVRASGGTGGKSQGGGGAGGDSGKGYLGNTLVNESKLGFGAGSGGVLNGGAGAGSQATSAGAGRGLSIAGFGDDNFYFGGGGGAGASTTTGTSYFGGESGGGDGCSMNSAAQAGLPNSGGGGGAMWWSDVWGSTAGGSGIVYIRYKI